MRKQAFKKIKSQKETAHENHERKSIRRNIFKYFAIITSLTLATSLLVLYGRGYRLSFGQGEPQISKTGILHVTSTPTSAEVYINDNLTTATSNSINLTPGQYVIKVAKEGYNDWTKDIDIEKEVVTNLEARLIPKSPSLQSISTFSVNSAVIDPTGTKIAFQIASDSARRNGVYVFEMKAGILPVLAGSGSDTQIADDTVDKFSEAEIFWSPDGKNILASISAQIESEFPTYYLLNTDGLNESPQNRTAIIETLFDNWRDQVEEIKTARLKSLKSPVNNFVTENFKILAFSPDEKKILYQASSSTQMPIFIQPRRIGNNLRYERRDLEENAIYVYDITEDYNTRIVEPTDEICLPDIINQGCTPDELKTKIQENPFTWFPDSDHLVYVHDSKISIVDDDGANLTTVYAGPFVDNYVFPWPDGSRLVIITNLGNPNVQPTLYTISLK